MISNNTKGNNKAISIKEEKTNKIKESHKSISVKEEKTKNLIELIEIIEQIKKQQNKDKIINKKQSLKEKKDLEEIPEVNNEKTFKRWEKDYLSLIQNIIYQQLNSSFRFDYNDYTINNKKKIFPHMNVIGFDTSSKEVKYHDSPIINNHKVDEIMDKFKFAQMKGQVLGNHFIPENVNPNDFEKFCYFKKLNPSLMILKYALNPL